MYSEKGRIKEQTQINSERCAQLYMRMLFLAFDIFKNVFHANDALIISTQR